MNYLKNHIVFGTNYLKTNWFSVRNI